MKKLCGEVKDMKLTVSELRARIKKTCKGLSAVEMGMEINELYPALARRIIKKADEAASGMLTLPGTGGVPGFIGNPPDWYHVPDGNKEYLFSLNRLTHLKLISEAYSLTGNVMYAETVTGQLENWLDNVTPPDLTDGEGRFRLREFEKCTPWRALEVGIRGYRTLPMIISLTAETEYFTDSLLEKLLSSLKTHRDILYNISPRLWPNADHNHYLMENLGLMSISLMFPELDPEGKYLEHAEKELDRCMEVQCTSYGGQIEGCPSYHNGTVYWFSLRNYFASLYGLSVPGEYTGKLEKMVMHSLFATRPTGGNHPWGDSHSSDKETAALGALGYFIATGNSSYISQILSYIPKETVEADIMDNLWRMENKQELCRILNDKPQLPSLPLTLWDRDLNQVFIRDSWAPDAFSLMTGCRMPVKNLHAHMDPGGFDLVAYGRTMLTDPGIYTYRDGKERHDFKSTAWHNCATINGEDAWEYGGSWSYGPQGEGRIISFYEKENIKTVVSRYHRIKDNAVLTRKLTVYKGLLIIADRVDGIGESDRLTVFFHADFPEMKVISANSLKAEDQDAGIMITGVYGTDSYEILPGMISDRVDVAHPSSRVCFSAPKGQRLMITVVNPYRAGNQPAVPYATENGKKIIIKTHSGILAADTETLETEEVKNEGTSGI